MQLNNSVKENCVDLIDVESTYNLKFKDSSGPQEFLSTVHSLLTAHVTESLVTDEGAAVDHPMNSEMVVENLAHNLDLHASLAKQNAAHLSNIQKPVVLQYKTDQINISEQEVEYEPDRVPPYSETRSPLDTNDLPPITVPQQASSKDNSRSENETVQDVQKCSETDSISIDPIGSVAPTGGVNLPDKSSCSMEVSM